MTVHLVTPKDITTKGEEIVPLHSSTIMQTSTPIGLTVTEISHSKQKIQAHKMRPKDKYATKCCVCWIINLLKAFK